MGVAIMVLKWHYHHTSFKSKKILGPGSRGFTLAEVLITLTIIGIVAVMTIPTIVQNYKEKFGIHLQKFLKEN